MQTTNSLTKGLSRPLLRKDTFWFHSPKQPSSLNLPLNLRISGGTGGPNVF